MQAAIDLANMVIENAMIGGVLIAIAVVAAIWLAVTSRS